MFRQSDIVGAAGEDYGFADMLRSVWTAEHFTSLPPFINMEKKCRENAARNTRGAAYVARLTLPYLAVLRYLDRREDAGFAKALTEGLQGHKWYWSQKKNRDEFNGFVSLSLTGVAAMAWDRGMRFDVESDYMPASWLRGDHFRVERVETRTFFPGNKRWGQEMGTRDGREYLENRARPEANGKKWFFRVTKFQLAKKP